MNSWPQAIATFYLSGGVLGLLLLTNLSEAGKSTSSSAVVAVSIFGLVAGVVVTAIRLIRHARAVRRPDAARQRGPAYVPVDPRQALTWAGVGAVGAILIVLADRLTDTRSIRLTVLIVGAAAMGLAYWRLWRTPLRPMVPPASEDQVRGTRSES